jgi:hypothetical protein
MHQKISGFVMGGTLVFILSLAGCAAMSKPSSNSEHPYSTNAGWYLLQPPMSHGATASTTAPLYGWQEIAYFEKAAQCDAARQSGLTAYPSAVSDAQTSGSNAANSVELSRQLASSSLCVAASDPRLDKWPVLAMLTSKF